MFWQVRNIDRLCPFEGKYTGDVNAAANTVNKRLRADRFCARSDTDNCHLPRISGKRQVAGLYVNWDLTSARRELSTMQGRAVVPQRRPHNAKYVAFLSISSA